jgi:kynurenine formamidase
MATRLLPILILVAACGEHDATSPGFPAGRWIDLTHDFGPETVYWPTADDFKLRVDFKGITDKGYFYASNSYQASEHGGTHIDAPIHFAEGRRTVPEIPVERLIGEAGVVDVSAQAAQDPDYLVTRGDLEAWEKDHGPLPPIVLLNTGFHKYWPDRTRYMGTDERGPDAVAKLHFPGLAPEAAEWLVASRPGVRAVGIDTPSIDDGQSTEFRTHRTLFDRNVPAFENVANLDALPARGAWVVALPMKIRNGTGGPLRIVALLPE